MPRNKGMFEFAANFQVKAAEALDPRVVVDSKADLIDKETWPYDGDTLYLYNGLIVGVADEQSVYMLVDKDNALTSDYSGWKQVDGTTVNVVDSLESTSTTDALSANQGYVLDQKLTTLESKLTAIFTFKGTQETVSALPETDNSTGDVYHVTEDGGEYVWNGEAWELLGLSIDLSGYATVSSVETLASQIANDNVTSIDTTTSSGVGLVTGSVEKSVAVSVDTSTLANALSADLSGSSIKLGVAISDGVTATADTSIATVISELATAISTAAAGGITSITSTDGSIDVSGSGTSRDLSVNTTVLASSLVNSDSSLVADNGKIDITWIDVE